MYPNRREIFMGAGATAFLTAMPEFSIASMAIGDLQIDSISDGVMSRPSATWYANLPDEGREILERYGQVNEMTHRECNVTLLRDGTRTVLFDVGAGPDFLPGTGLLGEALESIGVSTEDITDVVFTHAHPDHINGVLDDFDDPLFYDANHYIGQTEWDHWTDPDTVNKVREDRASFAVGAARRLDVIKDQITLFDSDAEILPGVQAVASHGHTPGHMSFVLGGKLILLGDCVTDHHLSFERPEWPAEMDENGEQASASRKRILDMAATDQLPVLGYHLPGDGIGQVEKRGPGFYFNQEV